MRKEIVKVELTEDELKAEAKSLSIAEQELSAAEERLDTARKAWRSKQKSLVEERETCREEVHKHATAYRNKTRDEEVEVDEIVRDGVVHVIRLDTRETIRTKPLETGQQMTVHEDDDTDVDGGDEADEQEL